MRTLKKLIIATIMAIVTMFAIYAMEGKVYADYGLSEWNDGYTGYTTNNYESNDGRWSWDPTSRLGREDYGMHVNFACFVFNNIYCIQDGYAYQHDGFNIKYGIEIDGYEATLYKNSWSNDIGTWECEENNTFAGIINAGDYFDKSVGLRINGDAVNGDKSSVQKGISDFIDNFIDAMNDELGTDFEWGFDGGSSSLDDTVEQYTAEYGVGFKATLVIMENTKGFNDRQNLIAVVPEGTTSLKKEINIPVRKIWNDSNNAYGNRPSSITAKLYKNGSDTGKSIELNSSNSWSGTFSGVDDASGYSVQETSVPVGYNVSYGGSQSGGFTITNTLKTTSVTVTKEWDDNNNQKGLRPNSITVELYANGDLVDTITLNESNNWQGEFYELPQYYNGYKMEYTINEIEVDGYTCVISGNGEDGYTITNTLLTEYINIPVTKKWDDENNKYSTRPNAVTVQLYANGVYTGQTLTLNASNNWSRSFEGLEKTDEYGTEINYTIKENAVDGYASTISGNVYTGFVITNKKQADILKEVIITNTHTPEKIDINVTKKWEDESNRDKQRPSSITVRLMANGTQVATATLSGTGNQWTHTFEDMYKYEAGKEIEYTVEENAVESYTTKITGNKNDGFTITNTNIPKIQVSVTKKWDDDNNRDGLRKPVQVTLYVNEQVATDVNGNTMTATLESGKNWTHTFTNLLKYDSNGKLITYTVKEVVPDGYGDISPKIEGNQTDGYIITNKHIPEKTSVKVTKVWDDMNNLDDLRKPVKVTLMANGSVAKDVDGNTMTVTLSESNNWTHTFTNILKYYNQRTLISYTVEEEVPNEYTQTITGNQTSGYTITNKHEPKYAGYTEITGRVWMDGAPGKGSQPNGVYDARTDLSNGKIKLEDGQEVKVRLKDANGNPIKATYIYIGKDKNGNPEQKTSTEYALITNISDGIYNIRVNYDNSNNVYKLYEDEDTVRTKLQTAYVEFEYDGMKYTTVRKYASGSNTSKGFENVTKRNSFDAAHGTTTISTPNPSQWTDKNITAITNQMSTYSSSTTTRAEVVKRCNGNGTYNHTNHLKAWDTIETRNCTDKNDGHKTITFGVKVQLISNINLGLFEREQPDVAIFSDLTSVEVKMNHQKYTYLYGVRSNSNDENNVGLKAKFENKGTYTYRRPVNPSDIAYINDGHSNAMEVLVTYEVKVANLSTTLPVTINEIVNVYDYDYEIVSIVKGKTNGSNVTRDTTSDVYTPSSEFKQVKLKNLQIMLNKQTQSTDSDTIVIKYKINQNQVKTLLNNQAPLNNASEILSYSTTYGPETLYAEQRYNGRNGKSYGGYDYDSHQGNAGIHINGAGRLEASKSEDDTDIAPAFVLVKDPDGTKTLSGTIWEDKDVVTNDAERLGNGHKESNEKTIENVKVDLYNLDGTPAIRYKADGSKYTEDIYTEANGIYRIPGVVTGEYYVKYTYGNYYESPTTIENELETEKLRAATTLEGRIEVNARNYKSTIITDEDPIIKNIMSREYTSFNDQEKMWHITHNDDYTVAVDNMEDRLKIEDLTQKTYHKGVNMTAYTKPFETQVEFDTIGSSTVKTDSNNVKPDSETGGILVTGDIDTEHELSKLDFGIIERPQEDLIVQKTISYFKITLANGQILTEGNPNDPNSNINYAKTIGFREYTTAEEARNALPKRLVVEMDAELIQGAKLEVEYDVKVINNNEIDYNYQTNYNYYYYGDKTGFSDNDIIKATIEFVDYINENLVYNEDTNWTIVNNVHDDLTEPGYISGDVENEIKNNKYKTLRSSENGGIITLGRGEEFSQSMTASRLLANQDDNVFDNNAEIIKIDSMTARTVKAIIENSDGTIDRLDYEPGNYEPSKSPTVDESDDDRVEIIITPPTGITNNIMQYVIIALIGLIIAFIGITFIKKKLLRM